MVALNSRFFPELLGPGRIGFVAVNGMLDCVVIEGAEAEHEYRQRLREGWHVVEVRPICRSLRPKLVHWHPTICAAQAWSYSLVIMEHPAGVPDEEQVDPAQLGPADFAARRAPAPL